VIVVDAHAWVERLTMTLSDNHRGLLTGDAVSPAHTDFEVGSAVLRIARKGLLAPNVSPWDLIRAHQAMPFDRVHQPDDLVEAQAFMDNARYAEAIYLAMAKRLDCPVMSGDGNMVEAARIAGVECIDTRIEVG
jgi:predicted nucleic acid-binding protein